ncbi:hypothetical protein HDV63DRAFT_406789 [Trichoderma sp. SZMC 28014]
MEGLLTFTDFLNKVGDDSAWLNGIRDSQPADDEVSAAGALNDLGDKVLEENDAIASPEVKFKAVAEERAREIPLLPPPQLYNSFNDLFNSLQAYYRNNGAAIFATAAPARPLKVQAFKKH